jgi:hypothetical protein
LILDIKEIDNKGFEFLVKIEFTKIKISNLISRITVIIPLMNMK